MDKRALIEKIKAMAASPSCCEELKIEVENYFEALGTPDEKIATENLLAEIKADIVPIQQLLIFTHSNGAIEKFGAELAKKFAAHADELKRRGKKYCNCRACTLGLEILKDKDILLA